MGGGLSINYTSMNMNTHCNIFTNMYVNCKWGDNKDIEYKGSSGGGSDPVRNKQYIDFVRNFIINNKIKTVCDLGCGDWRISNNIYNDIDIDYIGYDVYKQLVNVNMKRYPRFKFRYLDIYNNKELLENAELYILKDILCHWKNNEIDSFLSYIIESKKCKYILICNGNYQRSDNQDLKNTGDWRPLSAKFLPLKKFNPEIIFEYDVKEVSLIIL